MSFFYNILTRKYLISFLDLFNDIKVARYDENGNIEKLIPVPIQFVNQDKFRSIISSLYKQDFIEELEYNLEDIVEVQTILPRLSFSITNLTYDSQRHLNKVNKLELKKSIIDSETERIRKSYIFSPVPYNIDVELNIFTNNIDDIFQIIEQILPYFSPFRCVDVVIFRDENNEPIFIDEISINIQNVNLNINDELSNEEERFFEATISFLLKVNYYLPHKEEEVITKIEPFFFPIKNIENIQEYNQFSKYVLEAKNTIIKINEIKNKIMSSDYKVSFDIYKRKNEFENKVEYEEFANNNVDEVRKDLP